MDDRLQIHQPSRALATALIPKHLLPLLANASFNEAEGSVASFRSEHDKLTRCETGLCLSNRRSFCRRFIWPTLGSCRTFAVSASTRAEAASACDLKWGRIALRHP